MAVALENVVKQLEDSGIVAPGKLKEFIPPKASPKDGEELLRELFKQNLVTKFQAQQFALGKAKTLILGEYTILDKIGAGGMGQVFKALHRRMDRTVAIKMLPPAMTKDAAAVARFEREVRAAAKLSHPNIVAAHDAGQANGAHFLVMEYVEGTDLSALVKKHGPLEGSKALNYILQTARGLEFAHKKGVIHRDIKPANLLLDKEGTVKILDMGLARIEAAGDQATQAELTGTGAVMGTVDYMSPEQAFNTKHADARADIYSLGCTLYYLLAGKATYDGETVIEKILGHREKPIPSLCDVQEGVPAEVQAIFEKMVAKKAEDRYQTMTEVIADLEKAIVGQSSPSNLKPPAETSDTGLTKFFKELPSPSTQRGKPVSTKQVAAPVVGAPKKAKPKLMLFGSIAGGVLSLIGIPLVLYLAFSGGDKPPRKTKPIDATPDALTIGPLQDYALRFSGQQSGVTIPTLLSDSIQSVTVEAYISTGNAAGTAWIVGWPNSNVSLNTYNGKDFRLAFPPKHNTISVRSPQGQRRHVAGVIDGQEARLYFDGKLTGKVDIVASPEISRATALMIGRDGSGSHALFDGIIDEVRISRGVRYKSDFVPQPRFRPDSDTLALYHCDEGTGTILKDSSNNNHHGQISGATWVLAENTLPPLAIAPFDAKQARKHQEAWANYLDMKVETPNSVGMQMVLIPPGEFLMGSTNKQVEAALKVAEEFKADDAAKGRIEKAERPQHKVVITKPLLMSATEVTIGQFKKFAVAAGYQTEAEKAEAAAKTAPPTVKAGQPPPNPIQTYINPGYVVSDDIPAAFITWNDAVACCKWLSEQEKRIYRLPTEAEWEYACRAGTTTQYSFGDDYNELPKYGWDNKNAGGKSHPVGSLLPNPFGLFDMHGNLYEWCGDYYDEKWYSTSPPNDPNGPSAGSPRVIRGGYWHFNASYCRSASRHHSTPSYSFNLNGFRCVAELDLPTTGVPANPTASTGKLFMHDPAFAQWVKDVKAKTAAEQIKAVSQKLVDLNPGFDGKLAGRGGIQAPDVRDGTVINLAIVPDGITDLSPLRVWMGLKFLQCTGNPGKGTLSDLSPLQGMQLTWFTLSYTKVTDLSPLAGMPLTWLNTDVKLTDLSLLQGMPLKTLYMGNSALSDLSPLRGMPLENLNCTNTQISDLSPLEECKNLKTLTVTKTKVTPAAVAALQKALPNCKIYWDDPAKAATPGNLFMHDPAFPQWVKDVQARPALEQLDAVRQKLVDLNPGFNGEFAGYAPVKGVPKIEQGVVAELGVATDFVTDISPLRALAGLTALRCGGSAANKGILLDLSPLTGLPLEKLDIGSNRELSDLTPIRGMKLTYFHCNYTAITDLTILQGMPITYLHCGNVDVTSLSFMEGMPLDTVYVVGSFSDLAPLAKCSTLRRLNCLRSQVTDLSPIKALALNGLAVDNSPLSDLTPLAECKTLTTLSVKRTRVTAAQVASLQKALPDCKITWDDPAKAPPLVTPANK